MSLDDSQIAQAVEAYRLWCYRNGKDYIAPDLSKVETTTHKGKPSLILRCVRGQKLARLTILESGFSVSWINWFTTRPRLGVKKKYTISSFR